MKILIISDIHGNYYDLKQVIDSEKPNNIVVLGDILSTGFYADNEENELIYELLKENSSKTILIKGNCDTLVNYDKLNNRSFDIITLPFDNKLFTFTHGHLYKKGFLPEYHGDIFINGHTHVPNLFKEDIIYANPGSLSRPRNGSNKGYLIYENNKLILKNINGKIIKEMEI